MSHEGAMHLCARERIRGQQASPSWRMQGRILMGGRLDLRRSYRHPLFSAGSNSAVRIIAVYLKNTRTGMDLCCCSELCIQCIICLLAISQTGRMTTFCFHPPTPPRYEYTGLLSSNLLPYLPTISFSLHFSCFENTFEA